MPRALVAILLLAAAAPARPVPPAALPVEPPRPDALAEAKAKVKARADALACLAGPHAPFDLTYLPRPPADTQALIAVRPNLVFGHPDLAAFPAGVETVVGHMLRLGGGNTAGPGLAGLDQLVLCGSVTIKPNPDATDGRTASFVAGGHAFVARTARPFDWAAAVRTWFPASEVRTHNGAEYRVMKLNLGQFFPAFPDGGQEVGFYVAPDGRTLVGDTGECLRGLIDRLAEKRAVVPPPGWDRVDTAAVAVAVDNRSKEWVWHLPAHPGPVLFDPANKLFLAADHLAVGLDLGPTTRFRLAVVCRDQFQAKHARAFRRDLVERTADRFAPRDDDAPSPEWAALGKLTDALLRDGTTTPTPLGFEYVGAAPGDLFGLVARMTETPAPPAARAQVPAAPVAPPAADEIPRTRSPIPGDPGVPGFLAPGAPAPDPFALPGFPPPVVR